MLAPIPNIIEPLIPTEKETVQAEESGRILTSYIKSTKVPTLELIKKDGKKETVFIPPSALKLLLVILAQMAEGNAITLIPIHAELTTQEAADLLNVSRPYLVALLEEGKIPHRKVGTRRRVLAKDILHYRTQLEEARHKALENLSKQAQKLNMGY